jgi:hypothetical protein
MKYLEFPKLDEMFRIRDVFVRIRTTGLWIRILSVVATKKVFFFSFDAVRYLFVTYCRYIYFRDKESIKSHKTVQINFFCLLMEGPNPELDPYK